MSKGGSTAAPGGGHAHAASAPHQSKTWRILVLGDADVGKTCLLRHFRGDADPTKHTLATVGIDMVRADVNVGGEVVKLQIWDTAGQERYRSIVVSFLRNTHGVLMCYDVTRRSSFNSVKTWLEALVAQEPSAAVVLCGNKADVAESERVVAPGEGAALARVLGVPFLETSAKTGLHVADAFRLLAENVVGRFERGGGGGPGMKAALAAASAPPQLGSAGAAQRPPEELAARVRGLDLVDTGLPLKLIREEEGRLQQQGQAQHTTTPREGGGACAC